MILTSAMTRTCVCVHVYVRKCMCVSERNKKQMCSVSQPVNTAQNGNRKIGTKQTLCFFPFILTVSLTSERRNYLID